MSQRYKNSESHLKRALKTVPLGSQTFSKSLTQYPLGVSPFFIERGLGAHVWDIDGNKYLDFINGLACVSIGYADEDINQAVKQQLNLGVSFSLPVKLEAELSERLVGLIPCAEMVRFGKNGSDVTSASIRLARAYTKKDMVLVCGYHGWQDWYIGSTSRKLGVPEATQSLTKSFEYNNIQSFKDLIDEFGDNIAAVIMEPMNVAYPKDNFLEEIRQITLEKNIVLVFDETITGFRFSNGGAQELFGVTPDLATFGKGLANGFPLSAIVGKKEIMSLMADIFYSSTFAGEAVSMAAANAVLNKIEQDNVVQHIFETGTYLLKNLSTLIDKYDLSDVISLKGHPSWSFIVFSNTQDNTMWELKTYFMQEMFKMGVLTLGSHNISFSHTKANIDELIQKYDIFLGNLKNHLDEKNGSLREAIECDILEPLFSVR